MGSNQQIFGRTSITINGVNFDSKPGAKLKMGGVKKEAVQGDNKTYFKRMKVPWVINADFIVTAETDIKTLTTEDGITASYTFDTGQSYTGHDGEIMHPPEADSGNGTVSLEIQFDAEDMRQS